ncbi:hypothetical protein ARALYDRAFT_893841 [Arabidopsis lyrata subsp. lyrata]|uniref:Uncharacterized protein n=1 Tax=Arabidopsis lyrata subsp. lyrata TaxID=81972 RepID=D7KZ35_ARALL|nr:hypothetical protein ARALYDRAFT_893841 [Arabidopsis lyrata subsp. lyrata]
MAFTLDKALQAMTIEENKPVKLKNLPKFSSCERNACRVLWEGYCVMKIKRCHDSSMTCLGFGMLATKLVV